MSPEAREFRKSFEVRFTELDHRWRATPTALFNMIQDTAISHSAARGLDPLVLIREGIGWFLTRVHMQIHRPPAWGEKIEGRTWPSHLKGLFAVREIEFLDASGLVVCAATLRWVLVDVAKRKPIRLPPRIVEAFPVVPRRAVEDAFEPLEEPTSIDARRTFHVRQSDLDTNLHANSVSYFDWMLETAPREMLEGMRPVSIEIAYKKEAREEDALEVRSERVMASVGGLDRMLSHSIVLAGEDSLVAVGRSGWRAESA